MTFRRITLGFLFLAAALVVPRVLLRAQVSDAPPVADARVSGTNTFPGATSKTITVRPGTSVFLWGQGSSADTQFYNWGCTGGAMNPSTSSPANSAGRNPIWTAPQVSWRTTFICALNVSDGALFAQHFDFAYITVDNDISPPSRNPIADARVTPAGVGVPAEANDVESVVVGEGGAANLWGAWSYDPDVGKGPALGSYGWSCTGGSLNPASVNQVSSTAINTVWTAPSLPAGVRSQTYACLLNVGDGQLGALQLDEVTMTVQRPSLPEANITADVGSVPSGQGTTIRWCGSNNHACANATSCNVGTSAGGDNIATGCSGAVQTGSLTSDRTYHLTTTGPGGTNTAQVTVTVQAAAPGPALSSSLACPNVTFSWSTPPPDMPVAVLGICFDGFNCMERKPNETTYSIDNQHADVSGILKFCDAAGATCTPWGPKTTVVDTCPAAPTSFLSAGTNSTVNNLGVGGSTPGSATVKANSTPVTSFRFGGGGGTIQCSLGTNLYAQNTFVKRGDALSCDTAAECNAGKDLPYALTNLGGDQNGNPIDWVNADVVCKNDPISIYASTKALNLWLTPGDFSLQQPTNTCQAGDSTPVTLSWGVSPAADKYNVFRVIDNNPADGKVQQAEIDAAPNGGNLNLPDGLRAADICAGGTCRWTDESAQRSFRYLYLIRSRNSRGVAYSDTTLAAPTLAEMRPEVIRTSCAPAASLTVTSPQQPMNAGQEATLTWTSANASVCTIDQGVGEVCRDTACDTGGVVRVRPSANTRYTLTCQPR